MIVFRPAALVALIVLLLFAHDGYAAQAANADALYTTGSMLYSDGDYAGAEKQFLSALSANRKHTSSMFMLGEIVSLDVKRLPEAEGWYLKALENARGDSSITPRTLFALGRLYILLGRYEESLECFRGLITQFPDYYDLASTYNHMGVAAYRLDRYDSALTYFKSALRQEPNLMEATFNMKNVQNQLSILNTARYHQRMGDDEAAARHYEQAIESYPNYVAAWYQLGLLYIGEGRWDDAIRCLNRAGALNHGYIADNEIPYRLAAAYAGRAGENDIETALGIYEELAGYKDSRLLAGRLYLEKGELDRAEELLEAAVANDSDKPSVAEAHYQLGLLFLKRGDRQAATGHFLSALSVAPEVEKYRNPPIGQPLPTPAPEKEDTDGMDGMEDYGG